MCKGSYVWWGFFKLQKSYKTTNFASRLSQLLALFMSDPFTKIITLFRTTFQSSLSSTWDFKSSFSAVALEKQVLFLHIVVLNTPPVLEVCCVFPSEGQQVTSSSFAATSRGLTPLEQCQRFLFQGGEGLMWIESRISHREEVGCHLKTKSLTVFN